MDEPPLGGARPAANNPTADLAQQGLGHDDLARYRSLATFIYGDVSVADGARQVFAAAPDDKPLTFALKGANF